MTTPGDAYVESFIERRREALVERADWIHEHRPQFEHGELIPGAQEGAILKDDAQLCYIFGVFSGSIILGQSAIENMVCGMAYSAGEIDERPHYSDAVDFLDEHGILAPDEVDGIPLDELNNLRNPLAHFRPPLDEDRLGSRSVDELPDDVGAWEASYRLLKGDAEEVLKTLFSVNRLFGVGNENV